MFECTAPSDIMFAFTPDFLCLVLVLQTFSQCHIWWTLQQYHKLPSHWWFWFVLKGQLFIILFLQLCSTISWLLKNDLTLTALSFVCYSTVTTINIVITTNNSMTGDSTVKKQKQIANLWKVYGNFTVVFCFKKKYTKLIFIQKYCYIIQCFSAFLSYMLHYL